MAISFTLSLTPNQIEFLQRLDLYAAGQIELLDVGRPLGMDSHFITHVSKLIREGLAEHVTPKDGERYQGGKGNGTVIRSYRITDKGRAVLGLIEKDVEAFLERQAAYKQARPGRKRA